MVERGGHRALAAVAVYASASQRGYADLFTRFDLSDAIDRAIAALPDTFRDVVLVVDVNDQSCGAAAAVSLISTRPASGC